MKYIYGVTDKEYEKLKDTDYITLGIVFILEHRNLFVGDFINLVNNDSKISFKIDSIKYGNKFDKNIVILGAKNGELFTILELHKIYGK
ncbi:MAG: hypothetical protein V1649_03565 [Patescibacteria group bacterium]